MNETGNQSETGESNASRTDWANWIVGGKWKFTALDDAVRYEAKLRSADGIFRAVDKLEVA